jgi:hypothetical protein
MGVTGWANASGSQMTLYVEVDFSEAVGEIGTSDAPTLRTLWDTASWDDGNAIWSSNAAVYTDITQWVRGVSTDHGFSRDTNKYNTSTATISLDNTDGRFSPLNTSSPYRVGAYSGIGPLRPARIRANTGFQDVTLFTGYVQAWNEHFPDMGGNATVEVSLIGVEARIGDFTRYAQTASGAGEYANSRITRILSSVGFTGNQYLSQGTNPLQATTLEGNAMNELQLVADSQGGALWFGPDGACYFDGIYSLRNRAANTFEGNVFTTVKDTASSSAQYAYSDINYSYDGSLTKNMFAYSAVGGATQTILDEQSRSLYGDRQVSRSDLLCTSDADVLTVATKDLALSKTPEFRVESLTVLPRGETDLAIKAPLTQWDMLFSFCQLRSGCKIVMDRRLGTVLPTSLVRYCLIQRINHNITPDNWSTSFEFTSATVLHAMTTPWDEMLWDSGVWSW